ncbi:Ras family [Plasmodiophora brassicae]
MGDGAVGKSCLIKRYCEKKFVSRYITTIGVDYGVKVVKFRGKEISINFWDLAGHPEFFDIRNEFYKDTQAALLVFDVGSRASFGKLDAWLHESVQFGGKIRSIVVCGNKVDLPGRAVPRDEAESWAASRGYKYFETSAKSGDNVDAVFECLFGNAVPRDDQSPGTATGASDATNRAG